MFSAEGVAGWAQQRKEKKKKGKKTNKQTNKQKKKKQTKKKHFLFKPNRSAKWEEAVDSNLAAVRTWSCEYRDHIFEFLKWEFCLPRANLCFAVSECRKTPMHKTPTLWDGSGPQTHALQVTWQASDMWWVNHTASANIYTHSAI